MKKFILTSLLLTFFTTLAFSAESLSPIQEKNKEQTSYADLANNVFGVFYAKSKNYHYKVVTMNTNLNADYTSTILVLVGEGAVGGEASYENAFLIPHDTVLHTVNKVFVKNQKVFLQGSFDFEPKPKTIQIEYNSKKKSLEIR